MILPGARLRIPRVYRTAGLCAAMAAACWLVFVPWGVWAGPDPYGASNGLRQLFVDCADGGLPGNPPEGYRPRSADFVWVLADDWCRTLPNDPTNPTGWNCGHVVCWGEVYVDGVKDHEFAARCEGFACCQLGDLDLDGDIDLEDVAGVTSSMTGPM